jgi:hypothetical protein
MPVAHQVMRIFGAKYKGRVEILRSVLGAQYPLWIKARFPNPTGIIPISDTISLSPVEKRRSK